jgi:hypothetical protein
MGVVAEFGRREAQGSLGAVRVVDGIGVGGVDSGGKVLGLMMSLAEGKKGKVQYDL